jgi:hypothetical protein
MSTTLSTIGLGDLHPISDFERFLGTLVMISGVALFSIILGNVQNSMAHLRQINNPFEPDQNKLLGFFGALKRFNGNQAIDKSIQQAIEDYFDYRWNKDLTQALQ